MVASGDGRIVLRHTIVGWAGRDRAEEMGHEVAAYLLDTIGGRQVLGELLATVAGAG
jgi:hypothetical protein